MRIIISLLTLTFMAGFAFADATGRCDQDFKVGFSPGGKLSIDVRPAEIEISGSDAAAVHVTCSTSHSDENLNQVAIRFSGTSGSGNLNIKGGSPHNSGVRVRIEVPRRTNLYVRSNAGDMTLSGVAGDKDVELYAGDLTILIGNPQEYSHADASVTAGNLTAAPFNVSKDGLFRSFSQDNPKGKYKLHAHLMAGDLKLR